jgi:hypothetical protein
VSAIAWNSVRDEFGITVRHQWNAQIANRAALCATIRQFDAEIDPERVGTLEVWRLKFGNKRLSAKGLEARYLQPAK